MIISAAIIICVGLVIHGYIERFSLIQSQLESRNTQLEIQSRQQKHEMEFAKMQAEMFRKETKRRMPAPAPEMPPTN